jgi:SsrA-binding protein
MTAKKDSDTARRIATNKKAYHEYHIEATYECGIVLSGTEIKSIRENGLTLRESYATVRDGEVWVVGMHIKPYSHGSTDAVDPTRDRKLLLHKKQIRQLGAKVNEQGFTLVPTKAYFSSDNRAKIEVGLARGKKLYDKRADIAKRDAARDVERDMKARRQQRD